MPNWPVVVRVKVWWVCYCLCELLIFGYYRLWVYKISILQLWGAVLIADNIASSSVLYDEGQYWTCAAKEFVIELFSTCTHPMPIEQ